MSGLESIAALGLACSVLQLIGSLHSSIAVAKNIIDSGTVDPSLADYNNELIKLGQDVEKSLGQTTLNKDDQELRDVARRSLDAAAEVKKELAKLSGNATKGRLLQAVGSSVKAILRRRRLEELKATSSSCQKIFETRLLVNIRYVHGMRYFIPLRNPE